MAHGSPLLLQLLLLLHNRYRRPKHQYHNHKSEVAARHSAFSRGSAYLERYCVLVALGAYLEAEGISSSTTFSAWLDARPELKQVSQPYCTSFAAHAVLLHHAC